MSEKVQGAFTQQVLGKSLESCQDTNVAQTLSSGVSDEMLGKLLNTTHENGSKGFKETFFTPHPPEKPKEVNERSPRKSKNKKRFLRRSNRIDIKANSSNDDKPYDRKGLVDDKPNSGSKLPPLSGTLSNGSFNTSLHDELRNGSKINKSIDKNTKHETALTLNLKPLSPIKDSRKVADDFRLKRCMERDKHAEREKGPIKPDNPPLDYENEQTSLGRTNTYLHGNNTENKDVNDVDDYSENTLTSVSSDGSRSDDSDSEISSNNDPNILMTQLSPKAANNAPLTNQNCMHQSSPSLNYIKEYPEQAERHSDTEAVRQGKTLDHSNTKKLWGKAKVVTLLPRVPASRARDRNSNFIEEELEKYLPERKLMVFVGTWNMHGEKVGLNC